MTAPGTGARVTRVLVIQDSLEYAELLEESLGESWRGEVSIGRALRLSEALDLVADRPFDCALLDLALPDAGGLLGIQALRQADPGMPIIVLTGNDDEELAVQALQDGAQDYLVKARADSGTLQRAILYAMERKRTEVELTRQANHDPLTGLANRTLFADRLAQAQARVRRHGRRLAVMFVDLDGFKSVNDRHGHDTGDRVLVEVARRLESLLRPSDTIARFGGDEFVLLCEQLVDIGSIDPILKRMRSALAEGFDVGEGHIKLSASIGIVLVGGESEPAAELLRRADLAMYEAKAQNGFSYRVFEGDMHTRATNRLNITYDLRRAIARRALTIHFQPQVDVASGRPLAVEALVRWPHPTHGVLNAAEFIPEAERTGDIVELGSWVLEESCRIFSTWRADDPIARTWTLSVNVAPAQLSVSSFPGLVSRVLRETGLPPSSLMLEITESTAIGLGDIHESIDALAARGVRIALDDFGTGYASISVLGDLPIDTLKIDRSCVGGIDVVPQRRRLLEGILGLADKLDLEVVAEGVETDAELAELRLLDCSQAQGFLFARPQSPDSLAPLVLHGATFGETTPAGQARPSSDASRVS